VGRSNARPFINGPVALAPEANANGRAAICCSSFYLCAADADLVALEAG
jgi:hypothetical protein